MQLILSGGLTQYYYHVDGSARLLYLLTRFNYDLGRASPYYILLWLIEYSGDLV
ncbi:hypothetical protein LguiA_007920 [Lonicera macranthoides]